MSALQLAMRAVVLCLPWLLFSAESLAADNHRPPNVILILMYDMGWRDVGFMGNRFVETPHIDRHAKSGLVFTQAYASAHNCAPTRACLMSGQYTPRHGIYTVVDPRQPPGSPWHKLQAAESKSELDTKIVTIAESLRDGGYATAFFGMWNLGRGRAGPVMPGGQGFQKVVFPENIGFGKDEYFDDEKNYLSDRLTDEVLKFVDENRERPFFVYYPDHAIHAPFNPKPELLAIHNVFVRFTTVRPDTRSRALSGCNAGTTVSVRRRTGGEFLPSLAGRVNWFVGLAGVWGVDRRGCWAGG